MTSKQIGTDPTSRIEQHRRHPKGVCWTRSAEIHKDGSIGGLCGVPHCPKVERLPPHGHGKAGILATCLTAERRKRPVECAHVMVVEVADLDTVVVQRAYGSLGCDVRVALCYAHAAGALGVVGAGAGDGWSNWFCPAAELIESHH